MRTLVPAKQRQKLLEVVDALLPGASFILVNNHDPKPLYYQLEAEYPRQLFYTNLERGPAVWRVEIGRLQEVA